MRTACAYTIFGRARGLFRLASACRRGPDPVRTTGLSQGGSEALQTESAVICLIDDDETYNQTRCCCVQMGSGSIMLSTEPLWYWLAAGEEAEVGSDSV